MNLKQFASTKKGQLILCFCALGAVWLILLINYGSSFLQDIPDEKKIESAKAELAKARSENKKLMEEKRKNQEIEQRYIQLASNAWLPGIDGAVETSLRRKISKVSEKQQFRLNSIGSVNPVRINNDFLYADISIQGAGDIDDVIRFLAELAKIEPRLSWRQLQFSPDHRFNRRQGGGVDTVNLAAQLNVLPKTRLNFRGTLRVLIYEGKLTPEKLKVTRLPSAEVDVVPEESEKTVEPETPAVPAEVAK